MKPTAIVMATRYEAAPVIRGLGLKRSGNEWGGVVGGQPVRLVVSGVGAKNAYATADRLSRENIRILVSAGFCGALIPGLPVGEVVSERIASSARPVRTPAERNALTRKANAVAVDMETQAIIEAGTRRGVPIRVVRVVSDTFEDDLTPLFGDHDGFSPWRIALRLLHPRAWPLALRLRAHSRVAHARLIEELRRRIPAYEIPADHATE